MLMTKFVNPFVDQAFKRIFGREESKRLMIDFLNAVIGDEHPIVEIEYGNREQVPVFDDGRTVVFDIYCHTSDGRNIVVEMQNNRQGFFKERSLYYAARSISSQGMKGRRWQYSFDAVYVISVLNFTDKDISDRLRTEVMLYDIDSVTAFTDRLHLIYLQMPLANKTEAECENNFDYWMYILNNMEKLNDIPFTDKNPVLVDLEDAATRLGMTYDEEVAYQRALKRMWDYDAGLWSAKEEGKAEGRAEGLAEGKLSIAKNMKGYGLAPDAISQITGLPIEEIGKL